MSCKRSHMRTWQSVFFERWILLDKFFLLFISALGHLFCNPVLMDSRVTFHCVTYCSKVVVFILNRCTTNLVSMNRDVFHKLCTILEHYMHDCS